MNFIVSFSVIVIALCLTSIEQVGAFGKDDLDPANYQLGNPNVRSPYSTQNYPGASTSAIPQYHPGASPSAVPRYPWGESSSATPQYHRGESSSATPQYHRGESSSATPQYHRDPGASSYTPAQNYTGYPGESAITPTLNFLELPTASTTITGFPVNSSNYFANFKSCKGWINYYGFTDDNFTVNKLKSMERLYNGVVLKSLEEVVIGDSQRSIWATAYMKAIFNSSDVLFPSKFCWRFDRKDDYLMDLMTSTFPDLPCPEWLQLSGFSDDRRKPKIPIEILAGDVSKWQRDDEPENNIPVDNITRALQQNANNSAQYLSNCANKFIEYLLNQNYISTLNYFCEKVLQIPRDTRVRFSDCNFNVNVIILE